MNPSEEKDLKRALINDNIIDRGYNYEDFQNFIQRTRGVDIEEIPYNSLKVSVNKFIVEKLNSTFSDYDFKMKVLEEKSTNFQFLYPACEYTISTVKQEETQLVTLENSNKPIKIEISDLQMEKSTSFFRYPTYTVKIECKELGSSVKRNGTDITWLASKLSENYPYDFVPPVKDFNSIPKNYLDLRTRYLDKFFGFLCTKRILRTSPLLYNFLTLSDDDFKKYRAEQTKIVYSLKPDCSNLVSYEGELKIGITPNKAILANSVTALFNPTMALFDKLINAITSISVDYANLCVHMKEASNIFLELGRDAQKFKYKSNSTIAYAHWNIEFNKCSECYGKMSKIYNEEIKEYFDFLKMSMGQLAPIYTKFEAKRDAYETYGVKLKAKKEALFESKKYSKWETDPNQYLDFQALQNDKKKSFQVMCYKENILLDELKKQVCIVIHKLANQFDRVCKYNEENILQFGKTFSEKYKNIIDTEVNSIKLFVPNFGQVS